ncbi:glycosyltransferase family 4 protein [candidate division KSB1 bacterium]|nr:glycosyltransferase family 4 protein [candidate division KSB1 bacterium]
MNQNLNILFVNSILMFAGGEIWMLTTMKELERRGHRVWLMCNAGTELEKRAGKLGINVMPIRLRGDLDPWSIFRIYRFLVKSRIDLILTNMEKELRLCGVAAKMAGKIPVVSRRGIDYPLKNNWRYKFTYNVLATQIVANSESTRRSLLQNAPWLLADRIRVIYNGIDPEFYKLEKTTDLRAALGLPPHAPIIGFVGQLNERKGIHELLPAFSRCVRDFPTAQLLLAGDGDLREHIRQFAIQNELQGNIHIAGFRDDIPNIMRTIDMLVLPSRWEGFGIVLIEAMAAAKPVITTNISSMPEIVVHGETGLIVEARNAIELYEAMHQLIAQPETARQLGQNGRERILRYFTLSEMTDQYENLFNGLVETRTFEAGKESG